MKLCICETDYLPLNNSGIFLSRSSARCDSRLPWGFKELERYNLGQEPYSKIEIDCMTDEPFPFYQFYFCEGKRILGFSKSPDTEVQGLDDRLLKFAVIWNYYEGKLENYTPGTGFRDFAYRGQGIVVLDLSAKNDSLLTADDMKLLKECQGLDGIVALNTLVDKVDSVLIIPKSFEGVYLVSGRMNEALLWMGQICRESNIEILTA